MNERRLVTITGVVIVGAGFLLHFVYAWTSHIRVVGLVAPVNESVWEHTKLLVMPVLAVGVVEAVMLRDRRRVAWATLVECVAGALAIPAIFYTYTSALGTGPVLWVDITSFVLVVAAGQWLHLGVLRARRAPVTAISLLGLAALVAVYAFWTVVPPDAPVFRA